MTGWSFDPVGGWWGWFALAAALGPLLAIGPQNRTVTRGRRWTLAMLRLASLLLLLAVASRPALETTAERKSPGTLLVLVDGSRSMQVEDALNNASRWRSVTATLAAAAADLKELEEAWDVRVYTFAQDLQAAAPGEIVGQFSLPEEARGPQTAIGASIEDALARESQQRVVAVLLLSDGAQRAFAPLDVPPQTAVDRLATDGIPLYSFTYGQPSLSQQADLRISDLLASDSAFAEAPMTVEGLLTSNGYANKEVRVQLLWEAADGSMQPVDARTVLIQPNKLRYPLKLEHVPPEPGEYRLTLRVESPEGEMVTTNNEQSTFVSVRKGGVKILYLAGSAREGGGPTVEPRFVRTALAAHADFDVDYELINYKNRAIDYSERLKSGDYDVILLGNLDAQALHASSWRDMAKQVGNGVGLAMLGGFHSFGPGGYRGTPMEAALPIEMGRAERQNFEEPIRRDMHLKGPLKFLPIVKNGAAHPIVQLDDDPTAAMWRRLPPLDGANKFSAVRLKPNAETIAHADDDERSPLLVLGAWGEGRTAALAVDSTWLWQMAGHGDALRRFWRQLALWLGKKDAVSKEPVWIRLDQRRYQQGSRVEFAVGVAAPEGATPADVELEVRIEKPDGSTSALRMARRGETYSGSFSETVLGGDYRVIASARRGGQTLGEATARFGVSDQDVELDQPAAEPGLMESLANQTSAVGGGAFAPEQFPDVLKQLRARSQEVAEEIVNRVTLWDRWPTLLTFVAVMSAEWFLRKRWGLV